MRASVLFLLLVLPAAGKDRPQYNYQDGILVSFRTEQNGLDCSHTANTSDDGSTTGRSSCQDTERTLYTVKSGDNTFVLTPDHGSGAKAGAVLSMGWSAAFMKRSVLANRMPGTPLLLRGDGKHYFVKIGDRESMFTAVEVR